MRSHRFVFLARLGGLALLVCFVAPRTVRAQGSRKDDIVLNRFGQPVAGASVTVCTSGATGTPCSPLASIYLDVALTQPLANPLSSDGQGNYHFYATPGRYVIQIYGAGAATTTIPDVLLAGDPTSPSFQSLNVAQNISALNLTLSGNLSVGGGVSSPSTLSAPQTGSAAPVQVGSHWYQGTQSGVVTPPSSGPALSNESSTGGTIAGGQTIYCVDVYENRNGATTASPQTSLAIPAGTNTNRVTAVVGDRNWTTGAYGFRVYCGTANGGPYYLQQQQVLSVNIASVSWSSTNQGTGCGSGCLTVTTAAAHGVWSGMKVTIAGVSGCTGNPNGTFTVQRTDSSLSFVVPLASSASGCTASTGTASWTNEINANHARLVQGYFILSQLNTSGPNPPSSNTAAIDSPQVALNASCPGGPQANACAGILELPAAGATLTTPLIVWNQQKIAGPSVVRTVTSPITCNWSDPWTGCVMVIGTSGSSMEGFNIASQGNGLFFFNTNVNGRYANGSITSFPPGSPGLYGAIRIMSATGQIYSMRFEDVYVRGDRASVLVTNTVGLNIEFNGARWDDYVGGFVNESGPGDPDRLTIGVGGATGGVTFRNLFTESGSGVIMDCRNTSCEWDNVQNADSSIAAGTPSLIRLGVDSWGQGAGGMHTTMSNSRITPSANAGATVQYVSNAANTLGLQLFMNSDVGPSSGVCIDEGNVLGTTQVQLLNVSGCDPTPGNGHVINSYSVGTGMTALGTTIGCGPSNVYGCPAIFPRQFLMGTESAGWPNRARHWFIDTATSNWLCLNPMGTVTTLNTISQASFCVDNGSPGNVWVPNLKFGTAPGSTGYFIFAGSPTAARTFTWPDASGTPALVLTGTSGSLGGSALTAGTCSGTTVTVSGATTSMTATTSPSSDPGSGFYWLAFVSASNTVTVRICAAASGTPSATTYNVRVIQ